ncbi:MAG: hypothetical protein JWR26_4691 [Pedosphaera sp.]|nr:hypothetical protein [Pedosphaera sp.]
MAKSFATYEPSISVDFEDCKYSLVYVSLAFRKNNVDEEVNLRFQMRCQAFGLKCRPITSPEGVIQTAAKLTSPTITHSWFALEDVRDDAGLLIAKMFYLGCAAKQEANRRFVAVHLVGPFEGNPSMAVRWRGANGIFKYGG